MLLIPCLGVFGQQEYVANIRYLDISDGLSHNKIYCIHQDQEGLIWIGTKQGLNRYDGSEFEWWTKKKRIIQ